MKDARWAAAMVLGIAAVIAGGAGCGGSEELSHQTDCAESTPASGDLCSKQVKGCFYEDGSCFTCADSAGKRQWQPDAVTCAAEAKECFFASEGDICLNPGEGCPVGDGPCAHFTNTCGDDHQWHLGGDGKCD